MPKMTGAQALVRQLCAEGVDTVFALPGVQIMAAFDALYEVQDDIRLIQTRHEQATTYMADGYAKVTGKPGVAMVVPGPGALNAAAGLGTAFASSSPVLLISGQIPTESLGKRQGQLHEVDDQLDVFRPITKWNHRVTSVEEIPEAVHEAMRQLKTGRPRPVELEVAPDTLAATGDAELIEPEEYPRTTANASEVQRAAQLLSRARKPAIVAGGGTIIAGASKELLEVAELLQAPVMTTQNAKGILPEDHYLAVGVNYASVGPAHRVLPETDVLLAVGSRLLFRDFEIDSPPKIVHVDVDPDVIGKNFPTEVGIVADAREALGQLARELRSMGVAERDDRRQEIELYKMTYADELKGMAPEQVGIVETIRAALSDDAIVVSGITNIGYWANVAYSVRQPGTFITSSYFASLGYGFPTALGAQVGRPDRQVVALCGDGGFLYSPQELSTALRYGINLVAVVFNNSAYGASRWDQTHRYGRRFIGTDLHNPDFMKLADAFGVRGLRTDVAGLGASLREALSADVPVVLEVVLPNMMPPFQIVPEG
ncbi:MAG: thiamine pyrophosphate-binding protein [Chloroflexi bacterium]|nr:thiamine pyrophosphate-binding protein [Chloroflexota bacterium]